MAEKLLTLFTTPKPFKDPHIITIQRNALRSWQALGDEVEVLVIGNDEGCSGKTRVSWVFGTSPRCAATHTAPR